MATATIRLDPEHAHVVSRAMVATLLTAAALTTGCPQPRRTTNWAIAVGAEVAPVTADGAGGDQLEVVGGVHAMAQVAERTDEWVSVRGRVDLGVGGNAGLGPAGQLTLDAQLGFAFFDGVDHLFARVGLFGTVEGDPVTGLQLFEAPTLFFGYEHHGERSDTWHVDVGPRLALGVAGRALAPGDQTVELIAAPALGGGAIVMGEAMSFEVTYMHYFAGMNIDIVRGSACLGFFVGVCIDTRHVVAPFGSGWTSTGYYGIRFGVMHVTGQD